MFPNRRHSRPHAQASAGWAPPGLQRPLARPLLLPPQLQISREASRAIRATQALRPAAACAPPPAEAAAPPLALIIHADHVGLAIAPHRAPAQALILIAQVQPEVP
jgi:hypothetical protein